MKEAIRNRARELGFDICRFTSAVAPASGERLQEWLSLSRNGTMDYLARNADKRKDPQLVLPGARSVICVAASYFVAEPPPAPAAGASGIVARYARCADYHDILGERLRALSQFVEETGGSGTRSLWYVDTGPVLERDLAQRAGVGFVGKHTNLINRQLGNWFLLGEVLTTLELEVDASETNRCGHCTRCLEACPTQAITGPFQLDARLCISYLTIELKGAIPVELRPLIGNRVFGCDDCLAVCPWNRFAREGAVMRSHHRTDLGTLDLIGLLELDEAGFRSRFRGTPLLRSKRRGLLRNACVALGNVGDRRALAALHKACADPEPIVAEHAAWAVKEIDGRGGS